MALIIEPEDARDVHVMPQLPVNWWLRDDCIEFLRSRGLPTNGRRDELRQRVIDDKNEPEIVAGNCDAQLVREVILSLWMMLCLLMGISSATDECCNLAERLIRIFLTSCHSLDIMTSIASLREHPFWLTAYNFSVRTTG